MDKKSVVALTILVIVIAIFSYVFFSNEELVFGASERNNNTNDLLVKKLNSKINELYEKLANLNYGSDSAGVWGDFGKALNRIYSAALWSPDATSNPNDVLEGETFYSRGSRYLKTGTIPVRDGNNSSTAQSSAGGINYLTTPNGYYDDNDRVSATDSQIAALDPDLTPTNLLTGVNIFGVSGNIPIKSGDSSSTLQVTAAGNIYLTTLAGYYLDTSRVFATDAQVAALAPDLTSSNLLSTATVFGVPGNIAIRNGDNASTAQATAGGIVYLTSPVGYYDGNDRTSATNAQIAALSPGLASGNILSGVSIFGVNGGITIRDGDNASTAQATAAGINYLTAPVGYYDGNDRVSATNAQIVALDPNLASGNILTGVSIFGVTGTYPNPTNCATEVYHADYGPPVTEITNCSLAWTTASVPVSGDDNRAGRGGKDPRTGLVWSKYLKNNAGTVEFANSGGSTWSWTSDTLFTVTAANATVGATYSNNGQIFTVVTTIVGGTTLRCTATGVPTASGTLTKESGTGDATITFSAISNNTAVGIKSAIQLCSDRGSGWRLPTQIELLQAYIDGSYWNLTNPAFNFWSATESSATNAWTTVLSNGYTNSNTKPNLNYVRCVR